MASLEAGTGGAPRATPVIGSAKGLGFVELTKSDCDAAQAKTKRPAKKPA
jgi:hypothetical protein